MADKSKTLQFFANELKCADRDIRTAKRLSEIPMATLNIYNGSNKKFDLQIPKDMRKPLEEFIVSYFEKEKEAIYSKMTKELSNTK